MPTLHRDRKFISLLFIFATALPARAQLNVPLTIQEALYPGAPTNGVARKQEPVTVGIPLPDSAGIKSESQLGLKGAAVGQFRILGRWPSGNAKWVLVDTQVDLGSGGKNTSTSLTTGQGNFGGSALATDDGATISVKTGSAEFVIRKARFNLFDRVTVEGKALVAPGASQGLVLLGPPPGETACGSATSCTTVYASSLDDRSNAAIEENGPVRAVIKAEGAHKDAQGHAYMKYTVRMFFYKGKDYAKVQVSLRNADETHATSGDFNSANKGFQSYEARISAQLGQAPSFSIGGHSSPASGSFEGGGDAYLYQGYSDNMEFSDWRTQNCKNRGDRCVVPYVGRNDQPPYVYRQEGYQIVRNGSTLKKGKRDDYAQGWADLKDSSGAGIGIGVYQLAAFWPKSLEFHAGGSDVRIGIWPDQNLFEGGGGQPYYQAWPFYSIHDLWFNFHGTEPGSAANDFFRFQHFLVGRAPLSQYNNSGVFFYQIPEAKEEDSFYDSVGLRCCLPDAKPKTFRYYGWPAAGAGNQHEERWSYLLNFLQRGLPGRYLYAAHFYRMVAEHGFPRSDGFRWRDYPRDQLNAAGFPEEFQVANGGLAMRDWMEAAWEHNHVYGITDYYFLSGDEFIKDAILDGMSDRFLNAKVNDNVGGKLWNTRAVGSQMMAISRLYQFYEAIGDKEDATAVLKIGDTTLAKQVYPELNVSGFGVGKPIVGVEGSIGISRTRGIAYGCCATGDPDKEHGITEPNRIALSFHIAIMAEGLWEYAQTRGRDWSDYWKLCDLAYAVSEWARKESFVNSGTSRTSGIIYWIYLDYPNDGTKFYTQKGPGPGQSSWFNWYTVGAYTGDTAEWKREFELQLLRIDKESTYPWAEVGSHMIQATVGLIVHPPKEKLVSVPVTVKNNGGGNYTVSWAAPPGAQLYRIKYMDNGKEIVDWLNFNPGPNTFGIDPNKNWPWFAAEEAQGVPGPAALGTTQAYAFKGDPAKSYTFAMKAYVTAR